MKKIKYIATLVLLTICISLIQAQSLTRIDISSSEQKGIKIDYFNGFQQPGYPLPLISFRLNKTLKTSLDGKRISDNETLVDGKVNISFSKPESLQEGGFTLNVTLQNTSKDTLKIGNIVPFGESDKHVYLTAGEKGQPLSRSYIFRPGYAPVNVTLPDNLWELGMGIINVDNGSSIAAIARRDRTLSSHIKAGRFETTVYPQGRLVYKLYMDSYIGRWQDGVRLMFYERKLYDLPSDKKFDNTLYKREDLEWVRHNYVGHFTQFWNSYVYDTEKEEYVLDKFHDLSEKYFGGNDHYMVWCGWPVLGLDQRNQFDMTRALPGGLDKQKEIANHYKEKGTSIFTHFNPWDIPSATAPLWESNKYENPMQEVSKICAQCGYSGFMFDTRSEAGLRYQKELDKYNNGTTIFPEGMATPANMEYCLIGRTHEALSMAPFLNLTRMIKPEFKVYRQATVQGKSRRRDSALSFFNGHGVEFQLFVSPELDWVQDMYRFTGNTVRILRENSDNFQTADWNPLLPTAIDSIWVNEWPLNNKIVYTIYSLRPEGYRGVLFEANPGNGFHYVDLWNHREATIRQIGSKYLVVADIEGFPAEYLGTDAEAAVGAFARFPELLTITENNHELDITSDTEGTLKIWHGSPSYDKQPVYEASGTQHAISLKKLRANQYEGDLVIQLFDGNMLADERIVTGQASVSNSPVHKVIYHKSNEAGEYKSDIMEASMMLDKDLLNVKAFRGDTIIIYPQDMRNHPKLQLPASSKQSVKLIDNFGWYEGDFVVMVKQYGTVIDSTNLYMPYNHPRIYSKEEHTIPVSQCPEGMVYVKGGDFIFHVSQYYDWLCNYPVQDTATIVTVKDIYMDKYPVTNSDFYKFIQATQYQPKMKENFLKHWRDGAPVKGEENHPVVFVSYEDAKAYAKWVGKRLPTEKEWQYAAQAGDPKQIYPWGTKIDSTKCNTGNGILDAVGSYPQGANPLGLEDLVGSIWQMTNDWYHSGIRSYIMLKGSAYYKANSSWWYVQGGAKPLTYRQQLFRLSQSYERNGTTGFRLVKDAEQK